ncbi:MlaA family lipoprotein [Marinomonas aquiplantarum]|uniref:Phospholipid-binding lipoprotein MlaA n=1 Tax=Marinomonas aquiplantarum TaxID=491951 RepID=A0A366CXM0_9GAMM|nr:VacJ family lipoprotein [Marinomonas aquiplantarum]RBO82582.1 phospholipid-binding lipoprotein MlaA [Marinomonas aquiplantarum]
MLNRINVLLFGLIMMLAQSVWAATEEDPWEGFNRAMFSFNDAVDGAVLKPLAKGYKAVTPSPVQKGVSNFFSNLGEIGNITNNLLQGKWDQTASSTWRFIINSTAGWFGIFDVASELGLKEYDEDFGQTLAYWGVSSGPYLVLPFFGPSTVRDGTGRVFDMTYDDGISYLSLNSDERTGLFALDVVETRARLLNAESMIFGDRYSFIRDVYLQNRTYEIYDGNIPQKPESDRFNDADGSWEEDDSSWGAEDDSSWGAEDESSWGDEGESSWGDEDESSWGDEDSSWQEDNAGSSWSE